MTYVAQNQLVVFADDTHPRWLSAVAQLDYDTMAGTDKFGNMFIARLPGDVSASIENDPSGAKVCARCRAVPCNLWRLMGLH